MLTIIFFKIMYHEITFERRFSKMITSCWVAQGTFLLKNYEPGTVTVFSTTKRTELMQCSERNDTTKPGAIKWVGRLLNFTSFVFNGGIILSS